MESTNKNKLKIILSAVLGIGLIISLGIIGLLNGNPVLIHTRQDLSKQTKSNNNSMPNSQISITDESKADVNAKQQPSDPNKKLSSGISLLEAKLTLDSTIKGMEEKGYKIEDMKDLINQMCSDLGTTYEEILSLSEQTIAQAQTPINPSETVEKTSTNKPSGGASQISNNTSNKTFQYKKDKDGYTIPYNEEYDYNTWVNAWNSRNCGAWHICSLSFILS